MPAIALGFLLGVWTLQQQPHLPSFAWLAVVLTAALVPAVALYRLRVRNHPRWLRPVAAFLLGASAGFAWALIDARAHPEDALIDHRADVVLDGRIASLPVVSDHVTRFLFDVAGDRGPRRIRVSWYGDAPRVGPGEAWRLTLRLRQPRGYMNPGGFDYEGWLRQQGVWAVASVRPGQENRRLARARGGDGLVDRVRLRIVEGFRDSSDGRTFNGVLMALAVGYRPDISDAHWDVFLATGTNHLMAISGLHIGLMAGLGYGLAAWFWRRIPGAPLRLPVQRAGALAAIATGLAYALLAGLSVPTQRALVMLSVAMMAVWLGRTGRPWHVLSVALVAVLLLDPAATLGAGFWLSFGAVAVILLAVAGRLRAPSGWQAAVTIQVVVAVGLTPLLLIHFNQTSVVAPLANVAAVPWVGLLVVPVTLLSAVLMLIHPALGALPADLANWLMGIVWWWLDVLAGLPFARWQAARPAWTLWLASVGIVLWLAPAGMPGRVLAPVLCLPLLWPPAPAIPEGGVRLTLLDVGQGLAAVIQTRHHTLVYDAGPAFPSGLDTGDAVVVPFLRHAGIRRVDRLVISHSDNDHAGGAASVLARLPVGAVKGVWGRTQDRVPTLDCERGAKWRWDGVTFRVLHPPPHWGDDNISSCVVHVSGPGGSVLLPGDVDGLGEAVLLRHAGQSLQSDVLVLPHHGARDAASGAFLDAVAPQMALVGAGFLNRYGHPHPEVIARLEARGVPLRGTAEEGAMRVDLFPGEALQSPPGWRITARRYWHGE
ncbi:DNA internalization-related competence protein ComEC/Rec2 [Thioalkalivibrio denitrificans]|uniref:DNA internalization-related competence protein ComEC/Rec2 n=1 Tax=Thioalkalivibrio denitrificans TaxID=108003 RepID=A0A1V3NHI9_9GAMM|nr:DNA internalization-related competence protein ComEC/Rec2 [Thioalkalivibrio denitrificans]OOG24531.1 DNA internalization-related competence protein ComEC/Rec2 [Thioalkalivibrio denitrificans]